MNAVAWIGRNRPLAFLWHTAFLAALGFLCLSMAAFPHLMDVALAPFSASAQGNSWPLIGTVAFPVASPMEAPSIGAEEAARLLMLVTGTLAFLAWLGFCANYGWASHRIDGRSIETRTRLGTTEIPLSEVNAVTLVRGPFGTDVHVHVRDEEHVATSFIGLAPGEATTAERAILAGAGRQAASLASRSAMSSA